MKRAIRWLWRSAFALAIAAALGFGGYQAFAHSARNSCPWDPPVLEYCYGDVEYCQGKCDDYYGQGTHEGVCNIADCCICIALK
jgi:hypothetical protein